MDYQFRPLESWPGERTRSRKRSAFRTGWTKTLELLERELKLLGARQIVIQADCADTEIRNDGMLRASARLNSPAVILSFESKIGPLSYPCDRFDSWQDNIRAIACSLEALRSVDRYGVTRRSEQYRGWARLPQPTAGTMTVAEAKAIIVEACGEPVTWHEPYQSNTVRKAKVKSHPDRGGNAEQFKRVCNAAEVLGLQ